jgi:tetratricopeptide (TPR) repeat protein
MRVESGDLENGYLQARDFLKRRPDSGDAHFTMSYVLRYAGNLNEAARECERARSIDPKNAGWRSCGLTFRLLGDLRRSKEFTDLDAGTAWNRNATVIMMLREGRWDEILRFGTSGTRNQIQAAWWPALEAALEQRPRREVDEKARRAADEILKLRDGEMMYFTAGVLAHAAANDQALRLLRAAVEHSYCSYPAMDLDPAFNAMRSTAEFRQIRQAGIECQQRFQRFRSQIPS